MGLEVVVEIVGLLGGFGIGLQDLVETLLPAILADYVGLPAPDHDVEYPVKDDNDEVAKGKVLHLLTQCDRYTVIDQTHYYAEAVYKVGCPDPPRLEGFSAELINHQADWGHENAVVGSHCLRSGEVEQQVHNCKGSESDQLFLLASVFVVE